MNYSNVIGCLNLSPTIALCAGGKIKFPSAMWEAPASWFGFPPALVPIWSEGSRPTYIGYWKHWFFEREPSYVKMYMGGEYEVVEIARNDSQFLTYALVAAVVEADGITDEVVGFASKIGLSGLNEIDQHTSSYGDDPLMLVKLKEFFNQSPLNSLGGNDKYDGDFPSPKKGSQNWWRWACSFEIPPEIALDESVVLRESPWLVDTTENKVNLFDRFFSQQDFGRAWLTLNSTGWDIVDAKCALKKLRSISNDQCFHLLVDTWISFADESVGGY